MTSVLFDKLCRTSGIIGQSAMLHTETIEDHSSKKG